MEKLKALLSEKYPNIDFENEKALVSDGVLDSIEIVSIIAALEDEFDISVTMEYIQPMYFESLESMMEMIDELS